MKTYTSILAFSILLVSAPVAAQDILQGTILAFDRKANVLVFNDRSVFPLEKLQGSAPPDLKAGDRVEIKYDSNEDDGITAIFSITLLPK